jgi:hypothetical protein
MEGTKLLVSRPFLLQATRRQRPTRSFAGREAPRRHPCTGGLGAWGACGLGALANPGKHREDSHPPTGPPPASLLQAREHHGVQQRAGLTSKADVATSATPNGVMTCRRRTRSVGDLAVAVEVAVAGDGQGLGWAGRRMRGVPRHARPRPQKPQISTKHSTNTAGHKRTQNCAEETRNKNKMGRLNERWQAALMAASGA